MALRFFDRYGVGGQCGPDGADYTPPGGYICSIHGGMHGGTWDPAANNGTGKWVCPWCTDGYPTAFPARLRWPAATVSQQTTFPHAPNWTHVEDSVIIAPVNGWFSAMYHGVAEGFVDGKGHADTTLELGAGGNQGGQPHMLDGPNGTKPDEFLPHANYTNRIDPSNMNQLFIQNLFEELDSASEWFYDRRARKLYLAFNGTGSPANTSFVAVVLQSLLSVRGDDAGPRAPPTKPARNISIRGIGFRDAGYSYLARHGAPSGGDWGLQSPGHAESGAVFLEGTEDVSIDATTFKFTDGNAVYASGYHRGLAITNSEFAYIGDTAIALWGYTSGDDPALPPGTGADGTAGNQPRFTTITGNLCREIGFNQKQSSCVFMGKQMSTTIAKNVMFNGPRAHVNENDGFGGNNTVTGNLIYNACRETSDHGPYNSWDRQVYAWTKDANGAFVSKPLDIEISHNFVFANYGKLTCPIRACWASLD